MNIKKHKTLLLLALLLGVKASYSMDYQKIEEKTYYSYLGGIKTQNVYEKTFEFPEDFMKDEYNPFQSEPIKDNVPRIGKISVCFDASKGTRYISEYSDFSLLDLLKDEKLSPYIKDGCLDISKFKEVYDPEGIDGYVDIILRDLPSQGKKIIFGNTEIYDRLATKHVSLAQMEATSQVLAILSKFPGIEYPLEFCLVNFSTDAKKALFGQFPHLIDSANSLLEVSKNLPHKMPYPEFGTTHLATALKEIEKVQSNKHNDHFLVIVTDGKTYDVEETFKTLTSIRDRSEKEGGRLIMLTVGAGSVLSNQCDMGYLRGLLDYASKDADNRPYGLYTGAYKRYEDLKSQLIDFIKQVYSFKNYENPISNVK